MREHKIAVFVDGSNLWACLRKVGFTVDYDRILNYYNNQGRVVAAKYFTALPPPSVQTNLRNLTTRLSYHGWDVVSKETKEIITQDGVLKLKGNMDIEIAVHALKLSNKITDLILFSGDGDFACLVKALQDDTVNVTVVSHFSTQENRCMIADELRRQVNQFVDITSLRSEFEDQRQRSDRTAV